MDYNKIWFSRATFVKKPRKNIQGVLFSQCMDMFTPVISLQRRAKHGKKYKEIATRTHYGQTRMQPMRFDTKGSLIDSFIC